MIPPNLFILIGITGVVIGWRKKRLGLALATGAIGCFYLVSMPVVAALLMRSTEAIADTIPGLASDALPGAVIVLSADAQRSDMPGEPDMVRPLTLERLAEAARQQRRLGLPILVSGGQPDDHRASLAALMSKALQEYFGLAARWHEERSQNTFENASLSAAILRQAGIQSALAVAHRWDMARALWSFRAVDTRSSRRLPPKGEPYRSRQPRSCRRYPLCWIATMRSTNLSGSPGTTSGTPIGDARRAAQKRNSCVTRLTPVSHCTRHLLDAWLRPRCPRGGGPRCREAICCS